MADWFDNPDLYKQPAAKKSADSWLDDPSLYRQAPAAPADGGISPRLFDAFQETLAPTPAPAAPTAGAFDDLVPAEAAPAAPRGTLDRIGDILGRLGERFTLGTVTPISGTQEQIGDVISEFSPLAALRAVTENTDFGANTAAVRQAYADPVGAREFARQGAAITREAAADRAAVQARTAARPASIGEAFADPLAAADYYGGILAESAPQTLAAIATRNPEIAAGVLGALSAGQTYGGARADGQGVVPALGEALAGGAMETVLGRVPLSEAFTPGLRRFVTAPIAEAGTEAATGIGQSAVGQFARGKDVDIAAALPEAIDAAIVGAVTGLGEAALGGGQAPAAEAPRTALDDSAFADLIPAAPPIARSPDAPAAPSPEPVPAAPEPTPPAPAAAEPVAQAAPEPAPVPPVEAGQVRAPEPITPTEGRLEVDADTGRGQFRLVDEPAPAGADFSEFGQVRIIEAFDGDTKVGELLYANDGTPPTVNVEPEYQRRGIATAMYELARQQGGILGDAQGGIRGRAEQYRTPAGMAFRAGADASRITLAPARPAAVESAGAPPPAATPKAEPAPASPPVTPPAAVRAPKVGESGQAAGLSDRVPAKQYMAKIKAAQAEGLALAKQSREVVTPAEDSLLGQNEYGNDVYERADGTRYQMRNGRPDFGGFLQTVFELDAERAGREPSQVTPPAAAGGGAPAPTGTKNRITDAERAAEGRSPILRSLRQSNPETVSRAREAMANNPSLVAEITARAPDAPISVTEEAALLIGKVEARNRREEAAAVIADPKAAPERKAAAQRSWDDAEAEINRIDEANVARGREWGRLGQFRQREMAADFTLEAMESKLRRAKGGPLTAEETAGLKALSEKLQAAETDLEAARAKIAEYEQTVIVRETIEQAVRAATAQMRGASRAGKSKLEVLKERADAARKRLREAESVPSKRGQSGAVTNPVAMLADVIDIGAWHVANGAVKLADWVKAMTADLGSRFTALQDRWPDLFAAAKRANVPAKPDAPTTAEVLATIDPANVTREDVRDLVMARIRAGEKDADAIMRAVTADVQTVAPDATEADVRQLFADYGKRASPTLDADKQTLRDLRTVVRLEKDIADAEAGLPRKAPRARRQATEAVRQLRARLSELLKQAGRRARTPEAEAALLAKRREVLEKQIANLEDQVDTGRRPDKRTRPAERAPDLAARRDELRREIRRIDAAARPRRSPDEVYQQRRGTSIEREIERVQARIAAGDYSRSPRVPKVLNEANKAAAERLEKLRADFRQRQFDYEMANKDWMGRVAGYTAQALHLQRAIQTSWDLSGIGRQGVYSLFGHPIRTLKSIPEMLRAAGSRKERLASEDDIKSRENAPLYKKYRLPINDSTLNRTEEVFTSRWLEALKLKPKEGQPARNAARTAANLPLEVTRGSERAYATVLNRLRADAFDAFYAFMSEGGRPVSDAQGKLIADFVSAATGRSNVPLKMEGLANGLNLIYFAPRLVWSRFQVLYGHHVWLAALRGEWRAARFMAQEYGRVAGAMALFYALATAWYIGSGEEEDDEKKGDRRPFIDWDPRSSAFGQLRFGDHYVNPTGGLSQAATFMARMMTGETVTGSGETVRLSDDPSRSMSNKLASLAPVFRKYGLDDLADAMPEQNTEKRSPMAADFGDVLARFNRTKLSPVFGAGWDWITGEDFMGQPTTTADILANMMLPMTIGTPWEAYKSETPAGKAAALTLSEIVGWGVTHRDRAALDAPDQATMSPDQRKAYNEYLRVSGNMKQDIQAVRDLANSFPADTSASDVRDAVQMKAEELGLDGIDVDQYARKTPARDERGIRKTGLIRTETGRVKMEYAKGSRTKLMMDTEEKVDKLNAEMREFLLNDLTDEQINAKYREYVSGGDAEGNKELVIRQMRDQRDALIKDLMSYEN